MDANQGWVGWDQRHTWRNKLLQTFDRNTHEKKSLGRHIMFTKEDIIKMELKGWSALLLGQNPVANYDSLTNLRTLQITVL
jgi:hypothetical protein